MIFTAWLHFEMMINGRLTFKPKKPRCWGFFEKKRRRGGEILVCVCWM